MRWYHMKLFKLCWHKWGSWEQREYIRITMDIVGAPGSILTPEGRYYNQPTRHMREQKACLKCGKIILKKLLDNSCQID